MIAQESTTDTQHRILIIDDTESIHADFRKTLQSDDDGGLDEDEAAIFGQPVPQRAEVRFRLDSAMQGQEGFDKVRHALESGSPYAMAFIDMRMPPAWDGLQTIERIWQEDPNLQVVICTAYSDYSWDQIVQRLGVTDRLVILKKPFDQVEVAQLANALTQKWLMTRQATMKVDELEALVEQRTVELRYAAMHDKLTGLPNRAQLNDRLQRVLDRGGKAAREFAVLFLDFDRFKIINDSLGHEVGDRLLVEIAGRLRSVMNGIESDCPCMAARLGGDEFVILLEKAGGLDRVKRLLRELLDVLRKPYKLSGYEVFSTASVGITTGATGYDSFEQAIRDADAAMYRAKQQGKDRFVIFDASMHEQSVARLQIESDLRKAVAEEQFELYYQPIISLTTRQLMGFESLVRWRHPTQGIISPLQFIGVAEETGIINAIGAFVMRRSLDQLTQWRQMFSELSNLSMGVNLSKRQVLEPGMVDEVKRVLQDARLPPQCLNLEVTESIVMEKAEVIAPILEELKATGIRLSMDDFGTGHSSLNCLHRFPIDVLKIDRSFICNMANSVAYGAVVQAIITLANNLGMKVTAEGIETVEQLAQMQTLDCDYGQGYLFAKPCDAANATDFIRYHLDALASPRAPNAGPLVFGI